MKNIRKIIRKLIFEETSRLGVIKEMPFWLNKRPVSGLAPGETIGNHFQKLKDEQEKEFEDFQKKEKEPSQKKQEALGKLEKLRSQVILDEKASKALMEYFIHDSRKVYVGMNCVIAYLRSVDGDNENYHKNIFCHIIWYDRFSRHDVFYYTRESGIKPPDFGYEIGESLRE